MDPKRLRKLRERMSAKGLIAGPLVRRRAVTVLWSRRTPAALGALARGAAETHDQSLREDVLRRLHTAASGRALNADHVDAICSAWAQTRLPELARLVVEQGWVATLPLELRVLTSLKTRRALSIEAEGPEVVAPLLAALDDADNDVASAARATLSTLRRDDAREALCSALVDDGNAPAGAIAAAAGFAPADAQRRAVFYFLTGQWDKYESLDFESSLLRSAYDAAGTDLRRRLAVVARRAGRVEFVSAASGGRQGKRLGEMTDAEWEAALTVLVTGNRGQDLWQLAQVAPPRWGARILRGLRAAKWAPAGGPAECEDFEHLSQRATAWVDPEGQGQSAEPLALKAHALGVTSLAFSDDGQLLVTGGADRTLRLWSLPDGRSRVFQAGLVPLALAIARDGRVLAAGGDDGRVRLWGLPEGRQMSRLAAHVGLVTRLATLPSAVVADAAGGQPATGVLVTAGDDGHVRLWALPSGQQIRTLGPPARLVSAVTCLAVSADGRSIASGTLAGRVDLWNAKERVRQIKSAEGTAVNCLAFLDGGESLAVGSADGTIRIVACPGGRELAVLGRAGNPVTCLAAPGEGRLLAAGGQDGRVSLWHVGGDAPSALLEAHATAVAHMAVSGDGMLLATAGGDGTVALWGLPDGLLIQRLPAGKGWVNALAFSQTRGVLAAGGDDGVVRVWVSEALRLSRLPVPRMTVLDLAWIQSALSGNRLTPDERGAMEFVGALIARRHRHDVFVEDVSQAPARVAVGAFDIEIAG